MPKRRIERISPGLIRIGKVYYSDLWINAGRGSDGKTRFKRIQRALSTDKRIAEDKLADLRKVRNADKHHHAVLDPTYDFAKSKFLGLYDGKSKITLRHYLRTFRELESAYPVTKPSQITPDLVTTLYLKWKNAGRGLYVRNRDRENIISFMRKCEKWGLVKVQDWELSVSPDEEPRGRVRFYSPKELKKLLNKTYGMWHTMTLLGARAGLRPGEMFYLEWDDVDFGQNKIHIDSKPKYNWHVKKYERRTIPMVKDLRKHLQGVQKASVSPFVVAQEDGSRPNSVDVISTYYSRRVRASGLKGSPYTLRHTFGSHLAQAGRRLDEIRDLMGHRSVQTTEIYAHLLPHMLEDAVNSLPII